MKMLPVLLKDGYKVGHVFQYPRDTMTVYSNLTPRSTRVEGQTAMMFFGLQYFCMEYLIRQFDENFSLYVTHGIFSQGPTLEGIDEVFTTDSYFGVDGAVCFQVSMSDCK